MFAILSGISRSSVARSVNIVDFIWVLDFEVTRPDFGFLSVDEEPTESGLKELDRSV